MYCTEISNFVKFVLKTYDLCDNDNQKYHTMATEEH